MDPSSWIIFLFAGFLLGPGPMATSFQYLFIFFWSLFHAQQNSMHFNKLSTFTMV